jgi:HSP20 family protein
MTSVIRRPVQMLPDVFGWLEGNWPLAANAVRIEEYVDGDRYVVRAELPGFDPHKDIQVAVEHGRLVVTGERRQHEHDGGHSEFRYGSFSRTLPLPTGVRSGDITAHYATGILEVSMPVGKAGESKAVHIKVDKAT